MVVISISPFPTMFSKTFILRLVAESQCSSVNKVHNLITASFVQDTARIDGSHCYRIHSSPTVFHHFDDGYVEKTSCGLKRI